MLERTHSKEFGCGTTGCPCAPLAFPFPMDNDNENFAAGSRDDGGDCLVDNNPVNASLGYTQLLRNEDESALPGAPCPQLGSDQPVLQHHVHQTFVGEDGVEVTKCTRIQTQTTAATTTTKKANKIAVQKYRRKKKHEFETLKKENAALRERVSALEAALETKLVGESHLEVLMKNKIEELASLREAIGHIHRTSSQFQTSPPK